jgi:hypothetical protein
VNEVWCIKAPSLVTPWNLPWWFEMLIDLTLNWSRKGDSESRKETGGGDGFPTGELDRALAASHHWSC